MTRAGLRNSLVAHLRNADTSGDAANEDWQQQGTFFAKVRPAEGREIDNAARQTGEQLFTFEAMYADASSVRIDDRLVVAGTTLDVRSASDPDFRGRTFVIVARKVS